MLFIHIYIIKECPLESINTKNENQ